MEVTVETGRDRVGAGDQPTPPQCWGLLKQERIRGNWSAGLYVISVCLFQRDPAGCWYWMGWRGMGWRQSLLRGSCRHPKM